MKNLKQFKSFEISKNQLQMLAGGTVACEATYGCILTSMRDGNNLEQICIDVLCPKQ